MPRTLTILEAFDKAEAYLASDEARRFAVRGVTLSTERGLVTFSVEDGRVVGREVAA